jgi:hypothetical protein
MAVQINQAIACFGAPKNLLRNSEIRGPNANVNIAAGPQITVCVQA